MLVRAQRGVDELTARNIHADVMITSLTPLFATFHPPREPCNKLMKNMTTENIDNKRELRYNVYAVKNALKKVHSFLFYF